MESEYDRKFEEMKQYIPFLESMIKRLESTSTSSTKPNPRQAQLDKIRSLRDLLLDKKKRMKMENLLKCEQVLVNLYAKVEQKDSLPDVKNASEPLFPTSTETRSLETARNKLKSVVTAVTKAPPEDPDTQFEIASASETEVVCVPGSKEPALFHRRPNKASRSPEKNSSISPLKTSKRQYTRVLVSPEPSTRRWSNSDDSSLNKPLFSRRSPRQSPKRNSPHKKEKKKYSKQKSKTKDLNITLNVPEENLSSLNTEDILSRIIECPDNDVDIHILRDLKTQILRKLRQTGAGDDISDLIRKSYMNKKKKRAKKKEEIEEGELSDSESEAIQSIYGSLVIDKSQLSKPKKSVVDTDTKSRKIPISLVINTDKESFDKVNSKEAEETDLEMFIDVDAEPSCKKRESLDKTGQEAHVTDKINLSDNSEDFITIDIEEEFQKKRDKRDSRDSDSSYIDILSSDNESDKSKKEDSSNQVNSLHQANFYKPLKDNSEATNCEKSTNADIIPQDNLTQKEPAYESNENSSSKEACIQEITTIEKPIQNNGNENIDKTNESTRSEKSGLEKNSHTSEPMTEKNDSGKNDETSELLMNEKTCSNGEQHPGKLNEEIPENNKTVDSPVEIPLLNMDPVVPEPKQKDKVSEIDILQALKNEILSDTIAIPGTEITTPPLHQPKVTKVASAQEIVKKRISIEKYKEKSVCSPKPSLFLNKSSSNSRETAKKTSLKLTEEEQQRFNILNLGLDNSSEDEDQDRTDFNIDDIYGDLAPKSPENLESNTSAASPIIIPVDPVKPTIASSKTDVDMRTLMPMVSPKPVASSTVIPSPIRSNVLDTGNMKQVENKRHLLDPRVRREINNPVLKNSPNSDRTHRQPPFFTTSNMTPNARTFEMTPSRQSNLEIEDGLHRKHVYAPLPSFDHRDNRESVGNSDTQEPRWELNPDTTADDHRPRWDPRKDIDLKDCRSRKYDDRDYRSGYSHDMNLDYHKTRQDTDKYYRDPKRDRYEQIDDYSRLDCPRTPVHPFGRDCPPTPNPSFGRSNNPLNSHNRSDCTSVPTPFGRIDASISSSYSRADCPTTPVHLFGRSDCPTTPSHPFGRSDGPTTPIHPFGRSEHPMTPSHPFGRTDVPTTPIHPFGRSDAPMTPNHPFGRTEAPMTPVHPFGRTDMAPMTPVHPFGRSEYPSNPLPSGPKLKDPRLNRNSDADFKRNEENRDRTYYKDRRTDGSQHSYSNSDSYRNAREQSCSRNDRSGRQYRERTPGRDPSLGRVTLDYEKDRIYSRDRGRSNDYRRDFDYNSKNYTETGLRRDSDSRAPSVGRLGPSSDRFERASSRPPVDDRNIRKEFGNTLSVKPQSGRSFTIDTSVNTTFQEFLNGKMLKVIDYSSDNRSRRATSVGRTLTRIETREKSVGRNIREGSIGRMVSKPLYAQEDTSGYKRMVNFVRAKSLGRELANNKTVKSFSEIKADFKSYQHSYKEIDYKQIKHEPRSRKDQFDNKRDFVKKISPQKKTLYSPRKNNRDPRMNREQCDRNKNYGDKKTFGIVYSNDNIAKGTILGSGYGVKNYKIPKIKRPVEEIKEDPKVEMNNIPEVSKVKSKESKQNDAKLTKRKDINVKHVTKKDREKNAEKSKANNTLGKNMEPSSTKTKAGKNDTNKRGNRKTRWNDLSDDETIVKARKVKKAIIDSDSDSETISQSQHRPETKGAVAKVSESYESNKNKVTDTHHDEATKRDLENEDSIFDSSFGLDDVFPDSIAADPDLSSKSIQALIADLDKEIGHPKEDYTKDTIFDSLLENVDSPEEINESLNDVSEVIKQDLIPLTESVALNKPVNETEVCLTETKVVEEKESDLHLKQVTKQNLVPSTETDVLNKSVNEPDICLKDTKFIIDKEDDLPLKQITKPNLIPLAVAGTLNKPIESVNEGKVIKSQSSNEEKDIGNEKNDESLRNKICENSTEAIVSTTEIDSIKEANDAKGDRSSTPDSTININETNKGQNETRITDTTTSKNESTSDVSSTHDHPDTLFAENDINKEQAPVSIGNLLSILQDKSKITELLSMLGGQSSDNEKIKKKLEKLREIVSEDEDDTLTLDKSNENPGEPSDTNVVGTSLEKYTEKALQENDLKTRNINESLESITAEHIDNIPTVNEEHENEEHEDSNKPVEKAQKLKKGCVKKRKGKNSTIKSKRLTRSAANLRSVTAKKPSRELKQLQESLKEMFVEGDILNATGIRMCRLTKMGDGKNVTQNDDTAAPSIEAKPVVVVEKLKSIEKGTKDEKIRKKPGPKPKLKPKTDVPADTLKEKCNEKKNEGLPKYKPGPKCKKKVMEDTDPYKFDESISETNSNITSERDNDTESENESLTSSKSFGSSEVLADVKKKPKRKRKNKWNSGIISSNKKRKKVETKPTEEPVEDAYPVQKEITIPDMNCFTDKTYCFLKSVHVYSCRLCDYSGNRIVKHYKTEHPHAEIPLSRMHALLAREAIEQCEDINFQAVSKMPTEKYVCRFCYEEFGSKKTNLEEFFWHVVSTHTGEYKQLCSECVNVTRCPFNLDIPPPPKDLQGQLIGYICGKCYFTQISLENLKMHVIVRHNDEQTAVYTINLAVMSKKTMNALMKRAVHNEETRVLRSSRSNPSVTEISDPADPSDLTDADSMIESFKKSPDMDSKPVKFSVQSKLTFEPDENISDSNVEIKVENRCDELDMKDDCNLQQPLDSEHSHPDSDQHSTDIFDYPHFKLYFGDSGSKEYVCCVNGKDNHYKSNLLISMKKHVQTKHNEIWDGYCFVCKVIVMPQGKYSFKDCLQHMVDTHSDDFPILDQIASATNDDIVQDISASNIRADYSDRLTASPSYITVRPLSDLITANVASEDNSESLPKIQSVVSLGVTNIEPPKSSPTLFKSPVTLEKPAPKPEEPYKYEEMQADIMSKKYPVILDTMLSDEKLVQIYKCAGRFCSFTTDSADAAVLHASTHQRVGGENALVCAYCDFDCKGNAIDLVMHVFKIHGRCRFSCGQCFYRGIASQLVRAHMNRIHGSTNKNILETTTVTPLPDDSDDILPRDVAVQHYICADMEKSCKFRTYTQGKFIEHLQKHKPPYMCSVCLNASSNPTELLQHLKTHELKLYQCTWCLSGSDNEAEFLEHSSFRHPTRQPQAYCRIITNKGGASKILPLVKFNKSSVSTQLVSSIGKVDDPVREAERALDLEKIITSMSLFNETTETTVSSPSPSYQQITHKTTESNKSQVLEPLISPDTVTPPNPKTSEGQTLQNPTLPLIPVLKTEPKDTPLKNTDDSAIICLDSDEEESLPCAPSDSQVIPKPTVINLSEDDQISATSQALATKSVLPAILLKCGNCNAIFKRGNSFKMHLKSCFVENNCYKCAHCSYLADNLDILYCHYMISHDENKRRQNYLFICDTCKYSDKNVDVVKAHMKNEHGITTFGVITKEVKNITKYILEGITKFKQPQKRKSSGGPMPEASPKRKRYGAQDLQNIPQKPILDELAYCADCEFSTKVRVNLVRHIQLHADNQAVPQTAPVNPVPHLVSNEKHFDKMVNLASSSLELARSEKTAPAVTLHIPPEAAARYPKYVPDRQRHTCGAKGCCYISVDEAMLKCHWETLHSGTTDFHCVHCPPYQYLDTSKPLTAARIIAHLKMHDIRLYACSVCPYYHHRRQVVEKHVVECGKGPGKVMIVREEFTGPAPAPAQPTTSAAPTMDLKPWKCGLCSYSNMLRPEVVEHCSKKHNSKMQFKCPVCPFRTSAIENVKRHQAQSHPENNEDIFYYYYREGSIPDEPDGTPRWVKQRQKCGNPDPNLEPEVKTETPESTSSTMLQALLISPNSSLQSLLTPTVEEVNLSRVKKELPDPDAEESMEELYAVYGEICDPNGLKYKCPLCKLVTEDTKESIQSHLYEELQYRRWGCNVCSYKAFHKTGLNEHMLIEHRICPANAPRMLPVDTKIERWVEKVLEHQTLVIENNKTNLAKQKVQCEKPNAVPATKSAEKPETTQEKISNVEIEYLKTTFGQFCEPKGSKLCCPKCDFQSIDEDVMSDHLESELNKIRWRCSACSLNFQHYHEAQLHVKTCESSRSGQMPRVIEAIRDPSLRAAWLAAVIRTQKESMHDKPDNEIEEMTAPTENSLLVVRYEKSVPTPEEEMINRRKKQAAITTTAVSSPDSDDERLIIDEISTDDADTPRKKDIMKKCPYCSWTTKYKQALDRHILRHYNLRAFTCGYCNQTFNRSTHFSAEHPGMRERFTKTVPPPGPPLLYDLNKRKGVVSIDEPPSRKAKINIKQKDEPKRDDGNKLICLTCEIPVSEIESLNHTHDDKQVYFAKKGDVVVKCCVCLYLFPNVSIMQEHNIKCHPNTPINYAFFKLYYDKREIHECGHCNKRFKFFRDLKVHHNTLHSSLQLKHKSKQYYPGMFDAEYELEGESSATTTDDVITLPREEQAPKRVAKKSTTKLPNQCVAKKSTTKLPFLYTEESDSEEEYSYYGTKPTPLDELQNVTTMMPFYNTMMPFTIKNVSKILNIHPQVKVKDCGKK